MSTYNKLTKTFQYEDRFLMDKLSIEVIIFSREREREREKEKTFYNNRNLFDKLNSKIHIILGLSFPGMRKLSENGQIY